MKVLTGDETGLLKLVNVNKKEVVATWGAQARQHGVARAAWLPAGTDDHVLSSALVAALTKSGTLNVWDTATGGLKHACANAGADGVLLAARQGRFITCAADGTVRVFSQSARDADAQAAAKFSVKPSVACARLHAGRGLLAVGGREHDLALWDLETQQPVFQARNVGQTTLSLRVPVWVAGLQFLPELGAAAALGGAAPPPDLAPEAAGGHTLLTVTGHRHVRVYDTRATDRRPVRSVDLGDHPFTGVELAPDGRSVLTGDAGGTLRRVELGSLRQNGGYKGAGGSIRALAVHASQPVFASVGLDRALRVHHVGTRKLLRRVHLKQRLTVVLVAPDGSARGAAQAPREDHERARDGDDDDEDGGEEEEEEALEPEPAPDNRIRITQHGAGGGAAAGKGGAAGVGAPDAERGGRDDGEGGEEDVWKELARRAALRKKAGGAVAAAGGARAAAGAPQPGAKRQRVEAAGGGDADEDEEDDDDDEDDDDEEDDDEDEDEGGEVAAAGDEDGLPVDSDEEGDEDGAGGDAGDESEEEVDEELAGLGFSDEDSDDAGGSGAAGAPRRRGADAAGDDDDDDDDSADDDSDGDDAPRARSNGGGGDDDEAAAALVDSRKAAKLLLRDTKLVQMGRVKEAARAAIQRGRPAAAARGQAGKPGKAAGGGGGRKQQRR